jgi:hypothetical protein
MLHVIFSEEENTLLIYERDKQYTSLKAFMASMLEDPIVELLLYEKYHFDVLKDYIHWIEVIRRECEGQVEINDYLNQIGNGFNLANQMIRWKSIKDRNALQKWSDFLSWYSLNSPKTFFNAVGFSTIIQRIGLGTLEKRKSIFIEIVKNYRLEDILSLEDNSAHKI